MTLDNKRKTELPKSNKNWKVVKFESLDKLMADIKKEQKHNGH